MGIYHDEAEVGYTISVRSRARLCRLKLSLAHGSPIVSLYFYQRDVQNIVQILCLHSSESQNMTSHPERILQRSQAMHHLSGAAFSLFSHLSRGPASSRNLQHPFFNSFTRPRLDVTRPLAHWNSVRLVLEFLHEAVTYRSSTRALIAQLDRASDF